MHVGQHVLSDDGDYRVASFSALMDSVRLIGNKMGKVGIEKAKHLLKIAREQGELLRSR